MRVADWIIGSLYNLGLRKVFGVTGGAVVHLFDAASKHEDIDVTFFNHEQSASFAVESYSKLTGEISLCLVTTGPGDTPTTFASILKSANFCSNKAACSDNN